MKYEEERFRQISDELQDETLRFIMDYKIRSEKIIIATGGKSSPSQGSDGSGYALAKMLGHSVTKTYPALVPLNASPEITKSLKGVRVRNVNLT